MHIVSSNHYLSAQRLNSEFGNRWIALSQPTYSQIRHERVSIYLQKRNPYPVSPLAGRCKDHRIYKRWLWEQIKAGNTQVINSLRAIKEDTVFVDSYTDPKVSKATIICAAAKWLKSQPK